MESINAELEVIKMIEEELESREEVDVLNHRLKRIKNLASSIQDMIKSKNVDSEYVHKATNILCKYLGILWRNVFHIKY